MENLNEKKNSTKGKKSTKNAAVLGAALLFMILVIGVFYLIVTKNQIYTDKADIEAPSITINSPVGGAVKKILVSGGDSVSAFAPVAQVGDQVLRSDQAGIVISAPDIVGKTVNPGENVVTLIDPSQSRVVAHIDEDKGLDQIKVGQQVSFTVDTFGSKKFVGTVDEISATSRQSGVVFNISDQREIKQFDVKIKFDIKKYSELKNGMSAKVTIFK